MHIRSLWIGVTILVLTSSGRTGVLGDPEAGQPGAGATQGSEADPDNEDGLLLEEFKGGGTNTEPNPGQRQRPGYLRKKWKQQLVVRRKRAAANTLQTDQDQCTDIFAYGSTCFEKIGFKQTGWVVGPLRQSNKVHVYELHVQSDDCEITDQDLVGHVTITYKQNRLVIDYFITAKQTYIRSTTVHIETQKSVSTTDPLKFNQRGAIPQVSGNPTNEIRYIFSDVREERLFLILHAEICSVCEFGIAHEEFTGCLPDYTGANGWELGAFRKKDLEKEEKVRKIYQHDGATCVLNDEMYIGDLIVNFDKKSTDLSVIFALNQTFCNLTTRLDLVKKERTNQNEIIEYNVNKQLEPEIITGQPDAYYKAIYRFENFNFKKIWIVARVDYCGCGWGTGRGLGEDEDEGPGEEPGDGPKDGSRPPTSGTNPSNLGTSDNVSLNKTAPIV